MFIKSQYGKIINLKHFAYIDLFYLGISSDENQEMQYTVRAFLPAISKIDEANEDLTEPMTKERAMYVLSKIAQEMHDDIIIIGDQK